MRYISLRIENYKSFFKLVEIEFKAGINLIVGQNNVGKTALLDVLSNSAERKPHLNKTQKPRPKSPIAWQNNFSEARILIPKLLIRELVEDKTNGNVVLDERQLNYFEIENRYEFHGQTGFKTFQPAFIQRIKDFISDDLELRCQIQAQESFIVFDKNKELVNKLPYNSGTHATKIFQFTKTEELLLGTDGGDHREELSNLLREEFFKNRIYKFDIHRVVNAPANEKSKTKLESNCSNLSEVLTRLTAQTQKFNRYKQLVAKIFPQINDITLRDGEIRIWIPQSEDRIDLTVPLSDCGTGVGQVMAILYILVSSEEPQVIIIDEPNSFLHPSASRQLIHIFKQYDQHQYIISTHSPELITAAQADNIILLSLNEQGQTHVTTFDDMNHRTMQTILENIGSKLSELFGYDYVLWVEGQTEEACFPLIINKLLKKSLLNTAVLKVFDTGGFEHKHIKQTMYVYNQLIAGHCLIPPALAFIFDKEDRAQKDIDVMKKQHKIRFLDCTLYENYLLNYKAISSILMRYTGAFEEKLPIECTDESIENFVKNNFNNTKYWFNKNPNEEDKKNWKKRIHAAKLLDDIFLHFGDKRLNFQKTVHSKALTEWLILNEPDELDDLKTLLEPFFKSAETIS